MESFLNNEGLGGQAVMANVVLHSELLTELVSDQESVQCWRVLLREIQFNKNGLEGPFNQR